MYTQRLKANWRRAGSNLIMHIVVPYNIAWVGLQLQLQMKVRCWISGSNDSFDTLNQFFNYATSSKVKPDDNNPSGHHQERKSGEIQNGGDMKSNYRTTISVRGECTGGYLSPSGNSIHSGARTSKSSQYNMSRGGSWSNFSPALWI
jgi:hypothetical protein